MERIISHPPGAKLSRVYDPQNKADNCRFLYDLLMARPPIANISHKEMPSYEDHLAFVNKRPYVAWFLVMLDGARVGSVYMTSKNEIGIHILAGFEGKGLASWAVNELMHRAERPQYLANIAPHNAKSIRLFQKLGFKLLRTEENQNVYSKP